MTEKRQLTLDPLDGFDRQMRRTDFLLQPFRQVGSAADAVPMLIDPGIDRLKCLA